MTLGQWLNAYCDNACSPEEITNNRASRLISLVNDDDYGGVRLVSTRSHDEGQEAVVLDLEIPLGQKKTINDVRTLERIAVIFGDSDHLPSVIPLRDDFPNVPHLNAMPKGVPRSLCLYEEPWPEIKLQWTPLQFLERIRRWFEQTAYGELHADDQPLDPLFLGGSKFTLVAPPFMLTPEFHGEFVVSSVVNENESEILFLEDGRKQIENGRIDTAVALLITSQPQIHGRLHYAPTNLQELVEVDENIGSEVIAQLKSDIKHKYDQQPDLLEKKPMLLLCIPLQRQLDAEPESQSIRAFMLKAPLGEIGVALGVLISSPESDGSRWGLAIGEAAITGLSNFPLETGDVRMGFSPELAVEASGTELSSVNIVLIGAGALGSQLAMTLCREGFGNWVIVDKDILLPHNLARHELHAPMLGTTKSSSSAWLMQQMHDGIDIATSIVCDVLSPGDKQKELAQAFSNADLIIETSASVAVARSLAHNTDRRCPVVSLFFNPEGCDLVALSEGHRQRCRLDQIEIEYFRQLTSRSTLSGHLAPPSGQVLHSTSCREPSVQIPQNRIMRLVGRAAQFVRQCEIDSDSKAMIWHDTDQSQIITLEQSVSDCSIADVNGWQFVCSTDLLDSLKAYRDGSPRVETGGVIAGLWDREHKCIYASNALGPPADSVQERYGFIRGTAGLKDALKDLSSVSAGNIVYVGEWHTHPEGHSSHLSADDDNFLKQMRVKTLLEDSPALMVIVGDDGIRVALLDRDNNQVESILLC